MPVNVIIKKDLDNEINLVLEETLRHWEHIREGIIDENYICKFCEMNIKYSNSWTCEWCNENLQEISDICKNIILNKDISNGEKIAMVIDKLQEFKKKLKGSE